MRNGAALRCTPAYAQAWGAHVLNMVPAVIKCSTARSQTVLCIGFVFQKLLMPTPASSLLQGLDDRASALAGACL